MPSVAMTETYHDVEKLIYQTVWDFRNKVASWELEEMVSEANAAFVRAYQSYEADKAAFSTHLVHGIWGALYDAYRKTARYCNRYGPLPDDVTTNERREFNLEELVRSLPDDAKTVARLALCLPLEVALILAESKHKTPGVRRRVLKRHLRELGWTQERIAETFQQLQNALCS